MKFMTLDQKIEGVLFFKATPMKKVILSKLFECSEEELRSALEVLSKRLESGATRLIHINTDVELVTMPELDELIESIRKDEMKRDIGKAGAETLAIILYRGPVARADIDRIRGVNSSFILRNLMVRGLIEKDATTKNILYKATSSLMAHLGISQMTELPEFETIMNALDTYEKETALEIESA
ncbi:MAG: segregation and condensation protein B [Candidatus Azotimanducaceae bacterium]|jgi:segregation and condensation protein B